MAKYDVVCWIVLSISVAIVCSAEERTDLGVCTVLENLHQFRGKLITIRGLLRGNERHGYYVWDNSKHDCQSRKGLFLDGSIKLYVSQDPDVYRRNRDFISNRAEFHALVDEARGIWARDQSVEIPIAVSGEIMSPKKVFIVCNSRDVCWGNGYGPGGSSAAAMVIKDIDVSSQSDPRRK